MKNGWTGGQYSLYRAALGLYLAALFAASLTTGSDAESRFAALSDPVLALRVVSISAGVAALALASGFQTRVAALATACGWLAISGSSSLLASPPALAIVWLLLLQLLIPPAPYGSLAHRGAPDPGGGWRLPAAIFGANWVVLALFYGLDGLSRLAEPDWRSGGALTDWLQASAADPGMLRAALRAAPGWLPEAGTWA